MNNQLKLTFMWWLTAVTRFVKYIKRKFDLVYVIMRSDYSSVLSYPSEWLMFYNRKDARSYAESVGGHAVKYRTAVKIIQNGGKL